MIHKLERDSQKRSLVALALKLCEEAGEVAREVKKMEKGQYRDPQLLDELGDVLSVVSKIANKTGFKTDLVISQALKKRGTK